MGNARAPDKEQKSHQQIPLCFKVQAKSKEIRDENPKREEQEAPDGSAATHDGSAATAEQPARSQKHRQGENAGNGEDQSSHGIYGEWSVWWMMCVVDDVCGWCVGVGDIK